jgi:hypothetical protein
MEARDPVCTLCLMQPMALRYHLSALRFKLDIGFVFL